MTALAKCCMKDVHDRDHVKLIEFSIGSMMHILSLSAKFEDSWAVLYEVLCHVIPVRELSLQTRPRKPC